MLVENSRNTCNFTGPSASALRTLVSVSHLSSNNGSRGPHSTAS